MGRSAKWGSYCVVIPIFHKLQYMAQCKLIYSRYVMLYRDALSEGKDYFRGLMKGYEEGLNKAWDDLISLTTRGYSPREIQVMAKSKRQSMSQLLMTKRQQILEETGMDVMSVEAIQTITSIIRPGRTYVIEARSLDRTIDIFNEMCSESGRGLFICRHPPEDILPSLQQNSQLYWLTKSESTLNDSGLTPEKLLSPTDMPKILSLVRGFMKERESGIVVLDGIEYLIWQNDFNAVNKFLQGLMDQTLTTRNVLILPINPELIDDHDMHILEGSIENML